MVKNDERDVDVGLVSLVELEGMEVVSFNGWKTAIVRDLDVGFGQVYFLMGCGNYKIQQSYHIPGGFLELYNKFG